MVGAMIFWIACHIFLVLLVLRSLPSLQISPLCLLDASLIVHIDKTLLHWGGERCQCVKPVQFNYLYDARSSIHCLKVLYRVQLRFYIIIVRNPTVPIMTSDEEWEGKTPEGLDSGWTQVGLRLTNESAGKISQTKQQKSAPRVCSPHWQSIQVALNWLL